MGCYVAISTFSLRLEKFYTIWQHRTTSDVTYCHDILEIENEKPSVHSVDHSINMKETQQNMDTGFQATPNIAVFYAAGILEPEINNISLKKAVRCKHCTRFKKRR